MIGARAGEIRDQRRPRLDRRATNQVPQPAEDFTPSHGPGSAASTSAGGRKIGVASPFVLTHNNMPSDLGTRAISAGKTNMLTRVATAIEWSATGSTAASARIRGTIGAP